MDMIKKQTYSRNIWILGKPTQRISVQSIQLNNIKIKQRIYKHQRNTKIQYKVKSTVPMKLSKTNWQEIMQ